ncbi:delta-60 repeat domain-containing protein [Desulfosediminicola flagellatus]|uniref:delta-60 repeat domain-containing protein n=1 Tax=Desulfosediminicola flagellatus TaxID=2569541 RepID=UPI0010ABE092|nr:delta-60 repeat domain-containing protein [Desulfosediminicola flagellatus]
MRNLQKVITFGLISFSVFLGNSLSVHSAEGLDTTFGENGVAITDMGFGDDEAFDLIVQPDGKIIVTGFSYNGAVKNLSVGRYLADGTLDTEFNNGGMATFSFGSGDTIGRALALQEDGSIVIAGSTENGDQDMAVVRLTKDGDLDSTFGSNGHVILSYKDGDEFANTVAVTPQGAIVVSGSKSRDNSDVAAVVVRLESDGDVDSLFGEDGQKLFERPYDISSNALSLKSNGEILIAGSNSSNGGYAGSLLQLNSSGSPDPVFGRNGEVILNIAGNDIELFDSLIAQDEKIMAAGYIHNGSYRVPILVRFLENGDVDASFGREGFVYGDMGYDGVAYDLVQRPDGSFLMTGYELTPAGKDMILIEVDESGSQENQMETSLLDSDGELQASAETVSFSASYLVTDIASGDDVGRAIAVTPEGNVVTAGFTSNDTDNDIAVARYAAGELTGMTRAIGDSVGGVVTGRFIVSTFPIFDITRNSAAGGGVITPKTSESYCQNYCESECRNDEDADCEETCLSDCIPQSIKERGVTYSITPYPSYRVDDDDDAAVLPEADGIFSENGFDNTNNYTVVRSGQTSDGTGFGEFGSDINSITPDVLYYVRAFAVLEDDTVMYGNQVSFRTSDSCFIATAAFGSKLNKHVVVLRELRDRVLQKYVLGRKFIAVYYDYSPYLADFIRGHEGVRAITRLSLLPVVGISYLLLHGNALMFFAMLSVFSLFSLMLIRSVIRIRGEKRI